MGTWGVGAFENDTAADWLSELAEADDERAFLDETLRGAMIAGDQNLDAPDAVMAFAAAEIVAAMKGWPGENTGLSGGFEPLDSDPSPELVQLALEAIERIRTGPSELLELWSEGDATEWLEAIEDLRARLAREPNPERPRSTGPGEGKAGCALLVLPGLCTLCGYATRLMQ